MIARLAAVLILTVVAAMVTRAQEPPVSPTFEVATVKPVKSADAANRISIQPGGRLTFSNITLKQLIGTAYQRFGFDNREVVGGPDWIDSDRWEVMAHANGELVGPDGFPGPAFAMLRHLLAERFRLQVHHDRRERSVYLLEFVRPDRRLGSRLRRSTTDCAAIMRDESQGKAPIVEPGQMRPCSIGIPPGQLRASAVTLSGLANVLGSFVGRPVVDRSGLDGAFDIELEFSPESRASFLPAEPGAPPPSGDGPSLFTAVQEQLGLKLVAGRAPVDVLVIERAERPTAD
jgi:uncharacterized protein (TIGR03435 family)